MSFSGNYRASHSAYDSTDDRQHAGAAASLHSFHRTTCILRNKNTYIYFTAARPHLWLPTLTFPNARTPSAPEEDKVACYNVPTTVLLDDRPVSSLRFGAEKARPSRAPRHTPLACAVACVTGLRP